MSFDADESKAHFDVLESEVQDFDALLLLVWCWTDLDKSHCCPQIIDSYFGKCRPLIRLRDALHVARGGTFVDRNTCPDECKPLDCRHHGEPLNEQGNRERLSGPETRRPSQNVSYAANFGGLVRMLKPSQPNAKQVFRKLRRQDTAANEFISFVHRNYPTEEMHHYLLGEWRSVAEELGISVKGKSKNTLCSEVRDYDNYIGLLRDLL